MQFKAIFTAIAFLGLASAQACNPVGGGQCPEGQTCHQQGEFPNIGVCQ